MSLQLFFRIFSVKTGLVFTSDGVGHNPKRRASLSNENSPLIRLRSSELTRLLESQTEDLKPSITTCRERALWFVYSNHNNLVFTRL